MKSKIETLGRIRKDPSRGNLQLFQLEKPATFLCACRKVELTSAKVALNLQTGEHLCNGAYGELLANHRQTGRKSDNSPPFTEATIIHQRTFLKNVASSSSL